MVIEIINSRANNFAYNFSFASSLKDIRHAEWNALLERDDPFLCYEYLSALENNDCLGEKFGWYPHHLIVRDRASTLIAATPLYIKTNSYGEFVFDWSWVSAYEQAGVAYYPKIISSIPYTPIAGNRMLLHAQLNAEQRSLLASKMIQAVLNESDKLGMSGAHWLFISNEEKNAFQKHQLMFRMGIQFHWKNPGYRSFDHFLEGFVSRKRKKIKQERRYVKQQNINIKRRYGNELSENEWQTIHALYESTFYRKSGIPTLSLEFFMEVAQSMEGKIMLVLCYQKNNLIACAINFRSSQTLYGRFWGCRQSFHSLHFEACYYQGIEYAIENKLAVFEPGAQGEHKIRRGFLPTKTWSAHAIHDIRFTPAVRHFCEREHEYMQQNFEELTGLSPYHSDPSINVTDSST